MSDSEPAGVAKPKGKGHLSWCGAKPELAFHCRNLEDLGVALKHQIQQQSASLVPELVVSRFQFGLEASLDPVEDVQDVEAPNSASQPKDDSAGINYSVAGALSNFCDQKDKLRYQRSVAKLITKTIQESDGFRYIERRSNDTSAFDGYRFYYICSDSIHNKAWGNRRKKEAQGDQENMDGGGAEQKSVYQPRKETFDCKGHFKVIFSIKHLWIDILYRHLPIHRASEGQARAASADKNDTVPPEQMNASEVPWPPVPVPLPDGTAAPEMAIQQDGDAPPKKKRRGRPRKSDVNHTVPPEQTNVVEPPWPPVPAPLLDATAAQGSSTQPHGDAPPKKTRTKRAKKPDAAETSAAAGSYAVPDQQNLDVLVDALQAGIAGTNETIPFNGEYYAPAQAPSHYYSGQQQPLTGEGDPPTKKRIPKQSTANKQVGEKRKNTRVTTGCLVCRQRKIKCDEGKPACENCAKKDRQCFYGNH